MIAHIILFQPRSELTTVDRQSILDRLAAAVRAIPTVRRCRVGRRVRHGLPGYEQAMTVDYEYVAILEFDDAAGLREYLRDPAHGAIGAQFTSAAAAALAYDYAITDLGDAPRLV